MAVYLSEEGLLRLSRAIMLQAAKDLQYIQKHGEGTGAEMTIKGIRLFFRSPLCAAICGYVDPQWLYSEIAAGKTKLLRAGPRPYRRKPKGGGETGKL